MKSCSGFPTINKSNFSTHFSLCLVGPLPDGSRRKKLAGVKPPLYRLREGDWRFIYRIDGRAVRVLDLIRRRDLEDWLRRRR